MGCAILIESVLVTLTFQSLTALSSCSVSGVHFTTDGLWQDDGLPKRLQFLG